jgi:putative methyltransferase (TIGR04325 family)
VILLSSVLQYLTEPYAILQCIEATGADYIIIDRTPFSLVGKDHLTVQYIPKTIYPASYPSWIFDEVQFCGRLEPKFTLLADFDTNDGAYTVMGVPFRFRGMIWKRFCD